GWKPVVQTFVTHPTQLHTVTWQTEDGRLDSVTGTGEHPFYVVSVEKFVPMASLCVGDTLQLADGTLAWIVKAGLSSGPPDDEQSFTTYNFEVEDFHTYFVGETGAWVHNQARNACVRIARLFEKFLAEVPGDAWGGYARANQRLDGLANHIPGLERNGIARLQMFTEARRRYFNDLRTTSGTPPWQNMARQDLSPLSLPYDNRTMAQRLANNMKEAIGLEKPDGFAAHHIVPHNLDLNGDGSAVRAILDAVGVNLNEAANGVYIPHRRAVAEQYGSLGPAHVNIHTSTYMSTLRQRLEAIPSPTGQTVRDELQKIAHEISENRFPY
ncbi:MAG TPA: polymorphic toxin-type HINT domain-containing protein, partial [Phycisphaerales bacterium]|nr:polymorphic toxin-type HINT domain-containing protein [Phycisphaerales bacterium]